MGNSEGSGDQKLKKRHVGFAVVVAIAARHLVGKKAESRRVASYYAQQDAVITAAHSAGVENNKFHLECAEALRSESASTLTIVLTSALGALGYAAQKLSTESYAVGAATLAVAVHLMVIAYLLVRECLAASDIYPSHTEPRKLAQDGFSWPRILDTEIDHLEKSIVYNRERNKRVGRWLNGLRCAAFTAPVTWVAVWSQLSA